MLNLRWRTSVKLSTLKIRLTLGTLCAGWGIFLLVFSGVFLSINVLQRWGIYIFFLCFGLIACGLMPFRRLQRHESHPDILQIKNSHLNYYVNKIPKLCIPLNHIKELSFYQKWYGYGISLLTTTNKTYFFPFFSERSFEEIKTFIFSDD